MERQIFHFRIEELENFLEECKKQGKYITIDRNYPVEKMCDPRKKYEEEMNLFVEEYLTHLKNENMELKMRYLN